MKINIGCNQWKLDGFINIDIDPNVNPDLVADGSKLPYADSSVDEIYAGHMLEHYALDENVLKEWHRVLKIGGKITITVPDVEKGISEYRKGNITLDWLNQILFGATDRKQQNHHQLFTEDILISQVSKIFNDYKILQTSHYAVADVKWQTIIEAYRQIK